MIKEDITVLTDSEILDATTRVVDRDRRTTAELLALLAELDARQLYLGEGYASLFTYCTHRLHLSEPAAYSRITAARTARRFPMLLARLAEGDITLTTIGLLAGHLTHENHEALLDAARHQSKRDVERLVACIHPQPDIPSSIRQLAPPAQLDAARVQVFDGPSPPEAVVSSSMETTDAPARLAPRVAHRSVVAPLAPTRYLLRITIGADTHRKFERARDLLRHSIPDGDPAAIVDRALTVLLGHLEKTKLAATTRPRRGSQSKGPRSRRVPAAVKRAVWARDEGQCAFVSPHGRCRETGFLEFHHVRPFAAGGAGDVDNMQLRCRAHNAYEAAVYFGDQLCPDGVGAS